MDRHLETVLQGGRSYVKDTRDFLETLKHLKKVPSNTILATVDVLDLYPIIPHETDLSSV